MSSSGPISERTIRAVLMALWHAAGKPVPMNTLLRETLASVPDIQQALEQLTQRRCLMERTPGGVELISAGLPCWLDFLEHIAREKKLQVGRAVRIFQTTASTNDIAWQLAHVAESHGLLVIADEQTAGRGRPGHTWHAKAGQSILLSVVLNREMVLPERLTLLAGVAAAMALEKSFADAGARVPVEIRWPNDLLVAGKKIGGILVEHRGGTGMGPGGGGGGVGGTEGGGVRQLSESGSTSRRPQATSPLPPKSGMAPPRIFR
jgi:hypothetical protein